VILLTGKDTGLPALVWVKEITDIESHGGSVPFSRIYLQNDKENHKYFLDVLESKAEIKDHIKHHRLELACEGTHNSANQGN